MKHEQTHELIARGVFIENGAILVNHGRNAKTGERYFALPGGHIDAGEDSRTAVVRECQEELQVDVSCGDLVFVSESVYPGRHDNDARRHEIVLYFEAQLQSALHETDGQISSPESDKEFRWLPLAELPDANLKPQAFKEFLLGAKARYGFRDDT
ncbi:MAG TPA: NUDIX domain-containing protein [Abditibacteriaceae bacterium]|jgi:ADP-ribose pyrophosphatase YjhB (NUDIX family)